MSAVKKAKWNIKEADIKDNEVAKEWGERRTRSLSQMKQRTSHFPSYTRVSHGTTLLDRPWADGPSFSEGTTQAIMRKVRNSTIQRVFDGEISTQFDKNSIEQIETEYLFQNKVMTSEYDNDNIFTWMVMSFNNAWNFGFACNRSGFEKDIDGDIRVSRKLIQWNDIYPDPDAQLIQKANWYLVREYVSQSDLELLIDMETGEVPDKTYEADTVKYLCENKIKDAGEINSLPLADKKKGVTHIESVETWTCYRRGDEEFVTFVPSINAVLRRVKNYDPRKDVPLHFLILEPDTEFPLGVPSIMWTLGHQQVADSLQALAYTMFHFAMDPPLKVRGTLERSKIRMKPRAWWWMGTNPTNDVEPYRAESQTMVQYNSIAENITAQMMKTMNVTDATVASDANVMTYSGTPQGVESQQRDKTTVINQYQKRMEIYVGAWANYALRSYINSITGKLDLVVDEETRRKIWDIESSQEAEESIIDGDKITIDFSNLSTALLSFKVRTGSLTQSAKEQQRKNLQEAFIPISQMIGNISEQNKDAAEKTLMQMMARLMELSDIDISQSVADNFNEKLLMGAMQATMEEVSKQGEQLNRMSQAMGIPGIDAGQPPSGLPVQPNGANAGNPDIPSMPSRDGASPQLSLPKQLPDELPQGVSPQQPRPASAEFPDEEAGANIIEQ